MKYVYTLIFNNNKASIESVIAKKNLASNYKYLLVHTFSIENTRNLIKRII